MSIDNEYYLRFEHKGDAFTAIDPIFRNGPGGWMIVGSADDGSRAEVSFGFPVQGSDGVKLIQYSPATWQQLKWQFTDKEGRIFEVQSGHLAIELKNQLTLVSGSLLFKLDDGSDVEGTFNLTRV